MFQKYLMDLFFSIEQLVQLEADYKFTVLYLYTFINMGNKYYGSNIYISQFGIKIIYNLNPILLCERKKLVNFHMMQAVTKVTETLTTVISEGSSSGTEMTSTAFISVVSEFLSITQLDFASVKITSLALTIISAKVIREERCYLNR